MPSKFGQKDGQLRASSDAKEINPGSRLFGDLVASCYGTHVRSVSVTRSTSVWAGENVVGEVHDISGRGAGRDLEPGRTRSGAGISAGGLLVSQTM